MNKPIMIDKDYLRKHPNSVFVFGDNLIRKGKGGAAILRDEPNTYGFITKKFPNNRDESFYRPEEYRPVFIRELANLHKEISANPNKVYLISKLGAGLANRYHIWEEVIEPDLQRMLGIFPNVLFLWGPPILWKKQ